MGKITSIVGLVLIVAAGLVASISTNYEDRIKTNKELCEKYTKNAKEALKSGDTKKAVKFAKMAIKVDPTNKAGYKALEEIYKLQCKGQVVTNTKQSGKESLPANKPQPQEAEEEELGC